MGNSHVRNSGHGAGGGRDPHGWQFILKSRPESRFLISAFPISFVCAGWFTSGGILEIPTYSFRFPQSLQVELPCRARRLKHEGGAPLTPLRRDLIRRGGEMGGRATFPWQFSRNPARNADSERAHFPISFVSWFTSRFVWRSWISWAFAQILLVQV